MLTTVEITQLRYAAEMLRIRNMTDTAANLKAIADRASAEHGRKVPSPEVMQLRTTLATAQGILSVIATGPADESAFRHYRKVSWEMAMQIDAALSSTITETAGGQA